MVLYKVHNFQALTDNALRNTEMVKLQASQVATLTSVI